MEYRQLGASGLRVPALSFGTGTFGGSGPLFGAWGNSDAQEARRLLDICLEAGITLFDTADVYSAWIPGNKGGESEALIGQWLESRGVRRDMLVPDYAGIRPKLCGPAGTAAPHSTSPPGAAQLKSIHSPVSPFSSQEPSSSVGGNNGSASYVMPASADFAILGRAVHGVPGLVCLFGIESPGLTSSLAIADHVRDLLIGDK